MKKKKTNSGITLIALIITVIVLLILAGTAISITINSGDVLNKATTARSEYNNAVAEEERILNEQLTLLDYDKIAITTRQNGSIVELSWSGQGTKSLSNASEDEIIDEIVKVTKSNGLVDSNYTRNDFIEDIESSTCTLEDVIDDKLEDVGITNMANASQNEKLDAILNAWRNNGLVDNNYTRDNLIEDLEKNVYTREDILNDIIRRMNLTYIGEKPNITIKLGNEDIYLLEGYYFMAPEEGTYNIVITTASGKRGETEINVGFNGLTPLHISEYTVLYDSSSITTWEQLIESQYNTIELKIFSNNDVTKRIDGIREHVSIDGWGAVYSYDIIDPTINYRFVVRK